MRYFSSRDRLRATNAFLHEIADDLADEEWFSRSAPGQNLISFSTWHVPRVQDHFVTKCRASAKKSSVTDILPM